MTRSKLGFGLTAVLVSLGAAACSSVDADTPVGDGSGAGLGLGSTGPEVRAVFDYLARYGYFENAELRSRFPDWQPVVGEPPVDPDSFDEVMQEGVLSYQRLQGLAQTGIVDAATSELMARPRCGRPDVDVAELDPTRKFDVGSSWDHWNVSWGLLDDPPGVSRQAWTVMSLNALRRWAEVSEITFVRNETFPALSDITFDTATTLPGSDSWDAPAWASLPEDGSVEFNISNPAFNWQNQSWTEGVMTHEIGHALGLEHSSVAGSVMSPTSTGTLGDDDKQAIGIKYSTWEAQPGLAKDISGAPTDSGIWAIGTITAPYPAGNSSIHFWNGTNWVWDDPSQGGFFSAGVTIAAQTFDRAWVVNAANQIWRRIPGAGPGTGWGPVTIPVPAKDIAYSDDPSNIQNGVGSIWYVGTDTNLYTTSVTNWNPTGTFTLVSGAGAVRAVAGDGLNNRLYVVRTNGRIAVRQSGTWKVLPELPLHDPNLFLPFTPAGPALDIAVGGDGSVWVIGGNAVTGGFRIYIRNAQSGGTLQEPPAEVLNQWWPVDGGAQRIGVSNQGIPWVTNAAPALGIYRRLRR